MTARVLDDVELGKCEQGNPALCGDRICLGEHTLGRSRKILTTRYRAARCKWPDYTH